MDTELKITIGWAGSVVCMALAWWFKFGTPAGSLAIISCGLAVYAACHAFSDPSISYPCEDDND